MLVFAQRHRHGRRHAFDFQHRVLDAQLAALVVQFACCCASMNSTARLCSSCAVSSSKAFDLGQFVQRHIGDVFDGGEAFGGQQLRHRLVHVQRFHEQLGAFGEFLLAALGFLGFGQDVDLPAGELGGQPHILAAPADGQRQLLVGHHHFDAMGVFVQHDLGDFGRRQRVDDEGGRLQPTTE